MFQPSVRAQSQNLVEFKAGKMNMRTNNMVHPDTRKGLVYISQADDSLMHFCWKDRTTGNVEEDLIIFPDDAEFVRVAQCTTGRVYLLKLKPTNRKYFFWMQEPKSDKDEELCAKVNDLLNHPPPPGSIRAAGRTGGLDAGSLPDHVNGEMLQNALGHMDPNDLVQLLSLMGGGSGGGGAGGLDASALLGSFMGNRAGGRPAGSTIVSTPTAPSTTATTATPTTSATPANTTQAAAATPAAPHRVQLADLQSILSGIGVPSSGGAASAGDVQSFAQLLEQSEAGGATPAGPSGDKPKAEKKEKDKDDKEEKSLEPPKKKDKTDDEGMELD